MLGYLPQYFKFVLWMLTSSLNIAFNLEKQGILCCTSLGGKLLLQKLITGNTEDNTGFLMWISNYCFSRIFRHINMKTITKSVKYYIIRFSPNGTLDIIVEMNDKNFLFQSLVDIIKTIPE